MQENASARGKGVDFARVGPWSAGSFIYYSSKQKWSYGLQQTWCNEVVVSLVFKRQMLNTVNSME